ncbi:MAG: UrcA family protein [Sphingomicrobium sp.]
MTKYFPALLLALLPTPALAEPPAAVTSFVQTADLDLASKAGQSVLDRRLSIAISEVCGTASDSDLVGQNEVRRCRVETRARVADDREELLAAASPRPIEVAAR